MKKETEITEEVRLELLDVLNAHGIVRAVMVLEREGGGTQIYHPGCDNAQVAGFLEIAKQVHMRQIFS